ncbi:Alpha/Beta hydrolase protein [Podospora conica]|nr:Alpha/Beta hydrolase protein [Schizothecium conicum]
MSRLSAGVLAFAALAAGLPQSGGGSSAPIVDLFTSVHRGALTVNGSAAWYSFDNIPYAEPPVGLFRFKKPFPKLTINRAVNDGSVTKICPQANPAWFGISVPFMIETITGQPQPPPSGPPPPPPPPDPRVSEDCLLLDIKTPKGVFDASPKLKNLPVLVWIHGGGFAGGHKSENNPATLIAKGFKNGNPGFVYVAINYRLGLFGFPPKGPFDFDVETNAGLLDQRFALNWIKDNIHKFGGNPNAVTVFGESAGASSIAAQLAAYGGKNGVAPFKRAILQSPAVRPATDAAVYAEVWQMFKAAANVFSMGHARLLSTTRLQELNAEVAGGAGFAHFNFGPNVDGAFFPDQLVRSLAKGKVDKTVEVIVGYNSWEGLLFTDPRVQNNTAFKALFQQLMPSISAAKINQLATTVYPEDFSGAQPYTTQTQRTTLALGESLVNCNSFGVHLGYSNQTRAYLFDVFPGIHAQDVAFSFFNPGALDFTGLPIDPTIADFWQSKIVDFARVGTAAGSTAALLPKYTSAGKTLKVQAAGNVVGDDPARNARCRFWVQGLYS